MSNAYMIRLEMLKRAQTTLDTEYQKKCDMIRTDWNNKTVVAISSNEIIPEPELPPIYTMEQIVEKAKVLNDFVSQG